MEKPVDNVLNSTLEKMQVDLATCSSGQKKTPNGIGQAQEALTACLNSSETTGKDAREVRALKPTGQQHGVTGAAVRHSAEVPAAGATEQKIGSVATQILSQNKLPALQTEKSFTVDERKKIAAALGACQLVQRTYGKQAGDLGKVAEIFSRVLQEYTAEQIIEAIKQWLLKSPEFPTPSDIVGLLSPEPVFDKSVYIALIKERDGGGWLSDREKSYINRYKERVLGGIK